MRFIETPEEFEEWCEVHGYSKDDLSEILGVTRQTLYNWTHKRDYRAHDKLSTEIRTDMESKMRAYKKIPRMLSFALFALEKMAPESVFGGRRLRKRPKQL
jgi:DNA-binding XRE family transcriptional regulator